MNKKMPESINIKFNEFSSPPPKYRPMVRWWWPGLEVEEEELRREVRDLDDAGFGGAEIQPFAIGTPFNIEKDDPERAKRHHRFMQPYHYEMMAAVMDEAQKHGLTVDITQNSSWPTGGAHIPLEGSLQTLLFETTVVRGKGSKKIPVVPLKRPNIYKFFNLLKLAIPFFYLMRYIPEDKRLVKVIAGRLHSKKGKIKYSKVKNPAILDVDSMIDLTDRVGSDNRIHWDVPDGVWQIFFCYEGSAGGLPLVDTRSAPGESSLVVDHLSRDAITDHLEAFLGKGQEYFGEHFGKTFRAFFTDSFELGSPMSWREGFLEEFEKRRGYDLSPYLPVTYVPLRDLGLWTYGHEVGLPCFDFEGDLGKRIRYDFERTIADLFRDDFIRVLYEWGDEHGLQSRVQGYGFRADNLEILGYSHIPETEQLYGGGILHFLKLAGAAGTLFKRPVVTSESIVWSGRPYMTTPLKWRVAADRLFESGVNRVIYHGFPYRHPDYPYPGYFPWATADAPLFFVSEDFSRDAAFWQHYPSLNRYVSRMQYLMQENKTVSKLGIFYGKFDYPNGAVKREELTEGVLDEDDAGLKPNAVADMILGGSAEEGDRLYVKEMAELGDLLVANGYYYLNFNKDRLLQAEVANGKVIMGEAEFEALIFFKESHIPFEIAAILEEISEKNIPIIFVESLPNRQSGFKDWQTNDQAVKTCCVNISDKHKSLLNTSEDVVPFLQSVGIEPQLRFSSPRTDIGFIQKQSRQSQEQTIMLRNRTNQLTTLDFTLPGMGLRPYELDAMTGKALQISFEALESGDIHLVLPLEAYQSRVIGLGQKDEISQYPEAPDRILSNQGEDIKEITGWQVELSKRNVDGSRESVQASFEVPGDWRDHSVLQECSGVAEYQAEFDLEEGVLMPEHKYYLGFERVCDIATVTVNEVSFDPILMPPWQVDITNALRPGSNNLRVTVETTYRNMLVGYANRGSKLYKEFKKQVLMPSGLIGKVTLRKI